MLANIVVTVAQVACNALVQHF